MNRLRPLEHWDRGFEPHSRHGCLCLFCFCGVLCVGSGLATGWSPVQAVLLTMYRSKTEKAAKVHKGCRTEIEGTKFPVNLYEILGDHGKTKFLNPWAAPLNARITLSLAELAYRNSHTSYPCLINCRSVLRLLIKCSASSDDAKPDGNTKQFPHNNCTKSTFLTSHICFERSNDLSLLKQKLSLVERKIFVGEHRHIKAPCLHSMNRFHLPEWPARSATWRPQQRVQIHWLKQRAGHWSTIDTN
jgi:hypothetical protein